MARKFPLNPKHPERNCWGCDKYCPAHSLACGNGSERTQHPAELFGEDWMDWGVAAPDEPEISGRSQATVQRGSASTSPGSAEYSQ